ncbi:MAG: ABC transporter ATP-binding protein [Anaerolineales bacterium]|jgi:ABC-2 type transport system ATP-binding protein
MENSTPIILTEGLTRKFKENRAVDGLDLAIQPGELFGLVGPDGAGKTTTLRLLAGLLDITEGSARVAGYDLKKSPENVKPKIGYMAQQFSLYAELSVDENLTFFSELYDLDKTQIVDRRESLLRFAGLTQFRQRRAAQLSGGMQKKLSLACTLIHRPPILLLDEPTTGVDPVSRREFWNILTDLHIQGNTILISTPYMDEADRCTRVGLMYHGRLVKCAPPQEIRSSIAGELIELVPSDWKEAHELINQLPGVIESQTYGESLHILVDSVEVRLPQIKQALEDQGITCKNIRQTSPRMEEAFISMIRQIED